MNYLKKYSAICLSVIIMFLAVACADDRIDFSFAGLTFDSTREEIVQRLGEPHEKTETQWDYNYYEKGYVQFHFHNGKIIKISVEML